jgi:hypothetical protein
MYQALDLSGLTLSTVYRLALTARAPCVPLKNKDTGFRPFVLRHLEGRTNMVRRAKEQG